MRKFKLALKFCRGGRNPPPKNTPLMCMIDVPFQNAVFRVCTFVALPNEQGEMQEKWVLHNSLSSESVIPIAWLDLPEELGSADMVQQLMQLGCVDFEFH